MVKLKNETRWQGLTDSHCHLDHLEASEWQAVAKRAADSGVGQLIAISTDEPSFQKTLALGPQPGVHVFVTLGTHPHEAASYVQAHWEQLFDTSEYVAIGECGLDYHYMHAPKETQLAVFEHQLTMAKMHHKPVVVHIRESFSDTIVLIRRYAKEGVLGVVHCFTGDRKQMTEVLDVGWMVGFTGIITFGAKADSIREALRACPTDRILIETDSPYLAPVPYRGRTNEPAYLAEVAKAAAHITGVPLEQLIQHTTQNAQRLFGSSV